MDRFYDQGYENFLLCQCCLLELLARCPVTKMKPGRFTLAHEQLRELDFLFPLIYSGIRTKERPLNHKSICSGQMIGKHTKPIEEGGFIFQTFWSILLLFQFPALVPIKRENIEVFFCKLYSLKYIVIFIICLE